MKSLQGYLSEMINENQSSSDFANAVWDVVYNTHIEWLEEALKNFSMPKSWLEWNEKAGTGKLDNKSIKECESICKELIQLLLITFKNPQNDPQTSEGIKNNIINKKSQAKPWVLTGFVVLGMSGRYAQSSGVNYTQFNKLQERFVEAINGNIETSHDASDAVREWMVQNLQKKSVPFTFGRLTVRPNANLHGMLIDISYTPSKESKESAGPNTDIFGTQVSVGDLIAYSHGSIDTVMTGIVASAGNIIKVGRNNVPYDKCIVLVHDGKSIDFTRISK